jgi:lipopolysaccharide transport system permease protein
MENEKYHEIIEPKDALFNINLKELWDYRDLLLLFIRRDFVSVYKQTILGPIWFFLQPIFTTLIFTFVFGNLANISTDGAPSILFYMSGIVSWGYFSESLMKTSNTFVANSSIFGKVYFPRLILPISVIVSNLFKFGIQFILFLSVLIYYYYTTDDVKPNIYVMLLPFLLLIIAGLGLGIGLVISSLTTKYRDFQFLISFGIQLLMYATPIVYPLSLAKEKLGSYAWITIANPLTSVIETIKYAFLGVGELNWIYLIYSLIFMVIVLFLGIVMFNRVEKSFMDTV